MLIDTLPATKAKMRILNIVYSNKDLNVRNIIKLAKVSPNLAVGYLGKLEKYGLIKVKSIGGNKKNYVKMMSFNFEAKLAEMFYTIIEISRKEELINKYTYLKPFITQIESVRDDIVILIYGSYARFAADKESDLDLWVIGNINPKVRKDIEEILVTSPIKYSVNVETKKDFFKRVNDPIHQNILRDKIIIKNEKEFFKILTKVR